jgi:hypothetical protein
MALIVVARKVLETEMAQPFSFPKERLKRAESPPGDEE